MRKFSVLLYPDFSLQEITCLTSALTVWFNEEIDYIASENKEYRSEEGLRVVPTKITADAKITDYDLKDILARHKITPFRFTSFVWTNYAACSTVR